MNEIRFLKTSALLVRMDPPMKKAVDDFSRNLGVAAAEAVRMFIIEGLRRTNAVKVKK